MDPAIFLPPSTAGRVLAAVSTLTVVASFAVAPMSAFPWPTVAFALVLACVLLPVAIQASAAIVIDAEGVERRTVLGTRRRIAWREARRVRLDGSRVRRSRQCIIGDGRTKIAFMEGRPGFVEAMRAVERAARQAGVPIEVAPLASGLPGPEE